MKPLLVIIEGPQGVGKTTLTNWLRENIPSSNLLRLSGVADKSQLGKDKSFRYHNAVLDMISDSAGCDVHYIMDRSFITEQVYCSLGYKPYRFDDRFEVLGKALAQLNDRYDVHIINLRLSDTASYIDRLIRDKAEYQKFSVENSMMQQDMYYVACSFLDGIEVHNVNSDTWYMVVDYMVGHFRHLMPKYQTAIQDVEIMKQGGKINE